MNTTIELPRDTARFHQLIEQTFGPNAHPDEQTQRLRMEAFGALRDLHEENLQIMDLIDEAFDPEMLEEREREAVA